ncbi:helix-turn-helix domain-containing protein [Streptomyces sp. NPDC003042]
MTQGVETTSGSELGLPSPKERRKLREAGELTHEEVAAAMGVAVSTVRSWETGRTRPRGKKREAYGKFLARLADPDAYADADAAADPTAEAEAGTGTQTRAGARTGPGTETGTRGKTGAGTRAGTGAKTEARAETGAESRAEAGAETRAETGATVGTGDGDRDRDVGILAAPAESSVPEPAAPDPEAPAEPAPPLLPDQAFDALYAATAPALVRQAYLLTGRRALAEEAVERAFRQAWNQWPKVATDPDPVGWVRAASYEWALSPWLHLRRSHRTAVRRDKPPAEPADRILLAAMLALPPAHRRTVLLYDGVGLDLPDTAAETEASTPTAGHRLLHAHADLADRIPELADVAPEKQSALLRERFAALQPAVRLDPRPAVVLRTTAEHRARRWTRAALGLTAVIAVATAYTAVTAPTQYEPPMAPGSNVSGVPPHSGPQRLTEESMVLQDMLRSHPAAGPARISPEGE